MTPEEIDALHRSVFPVGKARWIKVLYKDFEWCVKNLRSENDRPADATPLGFDVLALGLRDEHMPQLQAVIDLHTEVKVLLEINGAPTQIVNLVNDAFLQKLEKLKPFMSVNASRLHPAGGS